MKPSGLRVVGGAVVLLAMSACEFAVAPEEGGTTSSPASQTASLEGEVGAGIGEGATTWGTYEDPVQPAGTPEPAGIPVPASSVPCVPALAGHASVCLPAPQAGDRSHGDPQPWQPAPVPQPY